MAPPLLPLISTLVAMLLATRALRRPIEHALRSRRPALPRDGQALLVWGIVALGGATMLLFLLLVLERI